MRAASRNCNAWLSKWLAELEWSECIALVGVHIRLAQAARLWQVAQIEHNRPDLVVAKCVLRAWHAGRPDPVVDDPFQLPVGIGLYVLSSQRWHRRRHAIGEWNAGVLPIQPVTCDAVVRKRLLAVSNPCGVVLERVLLRLVMHQYFVLGPVHDRGLTLARLIGLAAHEQDGEQ